MHPWPGGIVLMVLAYLLGSVSSGLWVGRVVAGIDVRKQGSHRTGATNVQRVLGTRAGIVVAVMDVLKGLVPVLVTNALLHDPYVAALAGLCAVIGHVWPVFDRFEGGRGVATTSGALLGLAAIPFLAGFLVMAAVVLLTRYVSLGSITAALIVPLVAAALAGHGSGSDAALLVATLGGALVALKHADNLHRLLHGTERRLGAPRK